jgi:predicted DsbA family dithiol-disulfide isomerase
MADALYRAPAAELVPEGIDRLAAAIGIDGDAFHACLADPRTARRIADDGALFDAIDGEGVPLVFIGDARFDGLQDAATLEGAVVRALSD